MPDPGEIFADELAMINDKSLVALVLEIFRDWTPDYFWTCPASTTGKYHPHLSQGEGGLIRHTKYAVWWGVELSRVYQLEKQSRDEVVAALLVHDVVKNGAELNKGGYPSHPAATTSHGLWISEFMTECEAFDERNPAHRRVSLATATHMGQWSTQPAVQMYLKLEDGLEKTLCDVVHLADYCAAQKADEKMRSLMRGV